MRCRHRASASSSAGAPHVLSTSATYAAASAACAACAAAASFSAAVTTFAAAAAAAAACAAVTATDASAATDAGVDVQRTWNRARGPPGLLLGNTEAWSPPNMWKRSRVAVLYASNGNHGMEHAW